MSAALRGRLPGRRAKRFGLDPAAVLGQDLIEAAGRYATVPRRPPVLRHWQSPPVLGFGTKRP